MDYELMRLECLKLAYAAGLRGPEAVAEAERMMKFAREGSLLGKVHGQASDRIETTPATVHRRPPFLDDYKPE